MRLGFASGRRAIMASFACCAGHYWICVIKLGGCDSPRGCYMARGAIVRSGRMFAGNTEFARDRIAVVAVHASLADNLRIGMIKLGRSHNPSGVYVAIFTGIGCQNMLTGRTREFTCGDSAIVA